MGTIIVGGILAAVVAAILVHLVRNNRAGKPLGCEGCSGKECHGAVGCACPAAEEMLEDMALSCRK